MDPDPTPDPTSYLFFSIFFSYNLPAASARHITFSLKIKFFAKIFILQALFQSAQHLYEEREESGRLKNIRACGSGS
jgi:hypothetical protein